MPWPTPQYHPGWHNVWEMDFIQMVIHIIAMSPSRLCLALKNGVTGKNPNLVLPTPTPTPRQLAQPGATSPLEEAFCSE